MILDNNLIFSNAVASNFTVTTGSTAIDLTGGVTMNFGIGALATTIVFGEDLGRGNGIGSPKIFCDVGTAMTSTNSATLNVQFQGSTDNSTWTTYVETGAMAATRLTANTRIASFDWPPVPAGVSLPRYVRLNYVVATGVFSTGTIFAGVALELNQNNVGLYPENFAIGP